MNHVFRSIGDIAAIVIDMAVNSNAPYERLGAAPIQKYQLHRYFMNHVFRSIGDITAFVAYMAMIRNDLLK